MENPTPENHPDGDVRYKLVDRALKRFQYRQDALIEVLHVSQEAFGFLSEGLLAYVARQLKLPQSQVYGVATFYHFFSLKPAGEHSCIVCMGTACYVKRGADIVSAVEERFGVKAGHTTADGKLSLSTARCLGNCGLAPMLVLDGKVLGRELPASVLEKVEAAVAGEESGCGCAAAKDDAAAGAHGSVAAGGAAE
jgi:bidirectional [NiFe] hydrogenase diaphorase subunit